MTEDKEVAMSGKKRAWIVSGVLLGVMLVFGFIFYVMLATIGNRDAGREAGPEQTLHYRYLSATSSNGMKLHALQTKPAFVTLEAIQSNVASAGKTGINGGFFFGEQLLSIAVVDGFSVNKGVGEYGSGGENVKYDRGTLVWDGASDSLSVQIAGQASQLKVKDRTRFWAQGGISMTLGDDSRWQEQIAAEHAPFPLDDRLRSAAVYDSRGALYLIVSETKGTLAAFREAIIETIGSDKLVDGIFLDGDGSSQLLSKEAALPGDNRPVVQMMRIVK